MPKVLLTKLQWLILFLLLAGCVDLQLATATPLPTPAPIIFVATPTPLGIGGDIITAINGQVVRDWNSLLEYLELHTQVEQTVTLSVLRDGQPLEVEVTLAAQP